MSMLETYLKSNDGDSTEEKVLHLANAGEVSVSRSIVSMAKVNAEAISADVVARPMICDDITKDFRYKLGRASALRDLLAAIGEAKIMVSSHVFAKQGEKK